MSARRFRLNWNHRALGADLSESRQTWRSFQRTVRSSWCGSSLRDFRTSWWA